MQINSLLPVLLQLLMSGEQNNKRTPALKPPSRQQPVQVHNDSPRPAGNPDKSQPTGRTAELEGTGQTFSSRSIAGKEGPGTQNELIFLPLPLRSEIFPDAKFYKQVTGRDKDHHSSSENQDRIVFGLKTSTLGELYFLIIQNKNNLSINCAASSRQAARVLTKSLADLKDKLGQLGWEKVHCSCFHVKNSGKLTELTPAGFIDFKI